MTANDDHAVRQAFAQWVGAQPGAPRDPQSLVEHNHVSNDYPGLLQTVIEGRRTSEDGTNWNAEYVESAYVTVTAVQVALRAGTTKSTQVSVPAAFVSVLVEKKP